MGNRSPLAPGFSTTEMNSVFSPEATVSAILEFEAALALALADVGIAGEAEALALAEACAQPVADAPLVLASTWETGTPLIALGHEIASRVDETSRRWFHHGATTQDAVDTGLMIQTRRGLEMILFDLVVLARRLRDLTVEHREQPQMARTFLRDAKPTTFGGRTANWLNTTLDHVDELRDQASSLPVQLGGPSGSRLEYGARAAEIVAAVAHRLGLSPSDTVWHTDRTRVLSIAQSLQRLSATMSKIATDVALLASSPISEVTVRSGGSSSMPEKENPIDSIRAIAAATACTGSVAMLMSAPPPELDRGLGSWHVEWLALPLAFCTTAASVEAMRTCLGSLTVDADRMTAATGGEAPSGSGIVDSVLRRTAAGLD